MTIPVSNKIDRKTNVLQKLQENINPGLDDGRFKMNFETLNCGPVKFVLRDGIGKFFFNIGAFTDDVFSPCSDTLVDNWIYFV